MLERRQARLGALDPDVDVQAGAELPSGRGASELDEPQVALLLRDLLLLGTAVGQVPAGGRREPMLGEPPQRIQPQVAKLRQSSAASPQMPLASSTTAAMSSALIRSPSRISGGTRAGSSDRRSTTKSSSSAPSEKGALSPNAWGITQDDKRRGEK